MVTPRLEERTNGTAIGKSFDGYQEWWEDNLKVTGTPPDVVEVVKPDQNSFEDHLQARTEKDVEVFDQVRLNMERAHEKEEIHLRRIKGTKCFDWANDLAWKKDERKERPGKAWCYFASSWGQHPLRDHPLPTPLTKIRRDLGVLPNTQTWIHLMSSITNHHPTFHYLSYCYCHVVIVC